MMAGERCSGVMTVQTVTLHIPEPLYQRLKERAQRSNRPVEEETLDVLAAVVPATDQLPTEFADAVAHLTLLEDDALWRAARSRLAEEALTQLEELHFKRQREGLTDAEAQTLAALVRQYERTLLVRARATAILHQRGHDVATLLTSP